MFTTNKMDLTFSDKVYSLLDVWQKINTNPVCFGARDNKYGAFHMTKTGRVRTMKLVRRGGSIHCNTADGGSYWGCTNLYYYARNELMTIITNSNRGAILPPDLKGMGSPANDCGQKKHIYSLAGTEHKSPELLFRNLSSPLSLSRNQELQIWYGQDFVDCSEGGNSGTTCVDVYAWYMWRELEVIGTGSNRRLVKYVRLSHTTTDLLQLRTLAEFQFRACKRSPFFKP